MYVPFDKLPDSAKVWIYQADRKLSGQDVSLINTILLDFTQKWEAHQQPIEASFTVLHDRFIVLAANSEKQPPTGCAIDKSVALFRDIEQKMELSLFDRMRVSFWEDGHIKSVLAHEISQGFHEKRLTAQTIVFNTLVQTVGELKTSFQLPAVQTWLKRYVA